LEFVALTTIAEVGATLAGFATLAGAIRGNAYDIESVYGAVLNGIIALVFALLALRFGGSDVGLRILAPALAVAIFSRRDAAGSLGGHYERRFRQI